MSTIKMIISSQVNRKLGKAMCDYPMLEDGDRVLVAVSGGVDSLVMALVLDKWRKKAPIHYDLVFFHIDNGYWKKRGEGEDPRFSIGRQLAPLPLVISETWKKKPDDSCFQCSRQRRKQLFDYADAAECNKVAFGHHKDDLIETFFLNMIYSGNISTMLPCQKLFGGKLSLIRPMAYLEKDDIRGVAEANNLKGVPNYCPFDEHTRRDYVRKILQTIYDREPGAKKSIFASLGNVRNEYLL